MTPLESVLDLKKELGDLLPEYKANLMTEFSIIGNLETQKRMSIDSLNDYNKTRINNLVDFIRKIGTNPNRFEKRIKSGIHSYKKSENSVQLVPYTLIDYVLIDDKYDMFIKITGTELWQPEIITAKSDDSNLVISYYRLTSVVFKIEYGCEGFNLIDCAVYINDLENKLIEFYLRNSLVDKINSEKLIRQIKEK